jgi:carbon storage regulator
VRDDVVAPWNAHFLRGESGFGGSLNRIDTTAHNGTALTITTQTEAVEKPESIDVWSLDAVPPREGVLQMLVLSRQRDESIIIGDNIVITIVDIRGDKVRLGIEAPKEVPVHRQEVYDAIQRERIQNESEEKVADDTASPST